MPFLAGRRPGSVTKPGATLRRGEVDERRFQCVVLDGAPECLHLSVGADQHEGGLGWNLEVGVDDPLVVTDLAECQTVPVDEGLE